MLFLTRFFAIVPLFPGVRRSNAGLAGDRLAPADPSAARRAAYLEVVKAINKQRAAGAELPTVGGFAQAAAEAGAPEGVATFWQAVASTVGGRKGAQSELVAGAKKHLEELHVRYLINVIRSAEPQTAALGGAPGAVLSSLASSRSRRSLLHCTACARECCQLR